MDTLAKPRASEKAARRAEAQATPEAGAPPTE
jgi:hypothetical protein